MSIAVGSVVGRSRLQNPMDSYQDEDLHILREKWSDALMRRRQYLDQQIQKLINKKGTRLNFYNHCIFKYSAQIKFFENYISSIKLGTKNISNYIIIYIYN